MADGPKSNRARKAVGPDRPSYLDAADVDRVMAVLLALISEVAAIRERLDAHERICSTGAAPAVEAVEAYLPDAETEAAREVWRDGYIRRLFRVLTEDIEALKAGGEPQP